MKTAVSWIQETVKKINRSRAAGQQIRKPELKARLIIMDDKTHIRETLEKRSFRRRKAPFFNEKGRV